MNISKYIIEQGVIGILIGTLISSSIINFIRDVKNTFFVPITNLITKSLGIKEISLVSSFIELITIFLIIYSIYYYILIPVFNKEFKELEEKQKTQTMWKQKILKQLDHIDDKLVSPSIW